MVNAIKKYLLYWRSIIGVYYVFFPHSIHMRYSPDWLIGLNYPHIVHVTFGIILLIWAEKNNKSITRFIKWVNKLVKG